MPVKIKREVVRDEFNRRRETIHHLENAIVFDLNGEVSLRADLPLEGPEYHVEMTADKMFARKIFKRGILAFSTRDQDGIHEHVYTTFQQTTLPV